MRNVLIALVIVALAMGIPLSLSMAGIAVSAQSQAAPPEVEDCIAFAKAGDVTIYRCEDWEMDTTCWVQELGIMQCLKD